MKAKSSKLTPQCLDIIAFSIVQAIFVYTSFKTD